jgi:membrane carboxypeptidase/penicillin-binding protein PbpC
VNGSRFLLVKGAAFRQRLQFSAVAAADAKRLYWFLDDELLGEADSDARVGWDLKAGTHRIRCIDDRGRVAVASFEVGEDLP